MDLIIKDRSFVVTGASSGFGRAVAEALLKEGSRVIVVARRKEKLEELENQFPEKVHKIVGDVLNPKIREEIVGSANKFNIDGIFINAGGPPAGGALEISIDDLDKAYNLVLKWKVDLVQKLMPYFIKQKYGRFLFLESASIKQPIKNLTLSNSFRMAVAGYVKTLSSEMAGNGITFNILAPGFHETEAIKRILVKKAETTGLTSEVIKLGMISDTPVQKIGNPNDLATLALWLLSPLSSFVTGQVYAVDGGIIKGNI